MQVSRQSPLSSNLFVFAKVLEPVTIPEDLAALDLDALTSLETAITAEFDSLYVEDGDVTSDVLSRLNELAANLERLRAETGARELAANENRTAAAEIASRIRGEVAAPAPVEPAPVAEAVAAEVVPVAAALDPDMIRAAVDAQVTATLEGLATLAPATLEVLDTQEVVTAGGTIRFPRARRLNFSLAEMREKAPKLDLEQGQDLTILASADIPGFSTGARVPNLNDLGRAMNDKAMRLPDLSGEVPIARIERSYEHSISDDMTLEQTDAILREVANPQSMVAAGGWCAPSLPIYDLFNIAASDGMIDLPTVGITRGGIRWPVSPTLADVLGNVWLWTEANDQAATGATGGPSKPCFRVACPTFSEARLAAWGICVTAGNLTEKAYPEVVANYIKLVMAAHYHVMNAQYIANIVAGSVALTAASPADGAAANILNAIELGAVDYREKFGMVNDAPLEVILPRWSDSLFRADLTRRASANPADALGITDDQINSWFDDRDVRVQWVADWQTRGAGAAGTATPGATAGLTAFPTSLQALMYAAGTWVLGDGGAIDLGVIRDSTLNAKNDHTAAWTEQFHLTAEIGHESRVYTIAVAPDGVTGAGVNAATPIA